MNLTQVKVLVDVLVGLLFVCSTTLLIASFPEWVETIREIFKK
jgi:hypothetical protein